MPDRYSDSQEFQPTEPSPRGKEIFRTISGLMHLYLNDEAEDAKDGISPEEHYRRHFVFYAGFVSGLEYMYEYPTQAVKLITEWRKHLNDGRVKVAVDETMARINDQLYPFVSSGDPVEKLMKLRETYQPQQGERVRPSLANGELKWDNVEPDKLPFSTFEEEWQQWL